MSDFDYESWWPLHLRVAKGESLSDQEAAAYELGLTRLEGRQEGAVDTLAYLRTLRAAINRAAALHADLTTCSVALDKKIAALESTYQQQTGQVLDLGIHAPPELDLVRQRYAYTCGYCGVTEVSAGGMLTVDHYHPLSAGGGDSLDNLVYACVRCNQYKHSFWPTTEERMHGFRILHPLHDIQFEHYRLNTKTGQLEPLTETGRFHITLLRLNRPQLVQYRLVEQLRKVLEGKLELLEQQVHEMEETIAAQQRYISALEERLG